MVDMKGLECNAETSFLRSKLREELEINSKCETDLEKIDTTVGLKVAILFNHHAYWHTFLCHAKLSFVQCKRSINECGCSIIECNYA